jgi:hypothetical protein
MDPGVLNQVGLFLGLIGVVLIFIWGPPQPSLEEGVALGLELGTPMPGGGTVADHNRAVRRRRVRHEILSRVGLGLIALGFAAQFIATFYQPPC